MRTGDDVPELLEGVMMIFGGLIDGSRSERSPE